MTEAKDAEKNSLSLQRVESLHETSPSSLTKEDEEVEMQPSDSSKVNE